VVDPEASASPSPLSSLAGKRIVITRAVAQSSELFEKLLEHRASPISLPLVSFSGPQDFSALDAALRAWQDFDWVLFTSANAVRSVIARGAVSGVSFHQPGKMPRIAAVGPATQGEAARSGLAVDHVAKTHLGVALAQELAPQLRDQRVFLPRSDRANPDLRVALQQLGAKVTEVIAYRTLPPSDVDRDRVTQVIGRGADAAIFFSPSAVHNLADLIGKQAMTELQDRIAVAAVGPVTSAALREYGVDRAVAAADTTATALIAALNSLFAVGAKQPVGGAKRG
jgi:uroporphyrinogen III methyltransferase/synthase